MMNKLLLLTALLLLPTTAFAQVDTDGDGVPDVDDDCPADDASFFDGDGDGCIDPFAHARHVEFLDPADLPLEYVIHEDGAPNIADDTTPFAPGADLQAVQDGFAVWDGVADATLSSSYLGTTTERNADGMDGINHVTFRDEDFLALFGNAVIAVGITTSFTEPTEFQGETVRPGRIVDADMLFNPNRTFSAGTSDSAVEIVAVATHEAGHLFGLNHSALPDATMFPALPAGFDATTLEIDDEVLAYMSYPDPASVANATQMSGLVTDGTAGIAGAAVFALPAGTDTPVAVQFTLPDGSWTLAGLPPGDYDVFVAPLDGGDAVSGVVPGYVNDLVNDTAQTLFLSEFHSTPESLDDDRDARTSITLAPGAPVTGVDVVTNSDLDAPVVLTSTPTNGTEDYADDGVILVQFSEPIDFDTLAGGGTDRIRLERQDTGGPVALQGQVVGVGDQDVVAFNPAVPLQFGATHTLTIEPGVTDLFGNPLASTFTAEFTVEPAPPLELTSIAPQLIIPETVVVISGQGFDTADPSSNVVSFDGITVPASQATTTNLVATVPEGVPLGAFPVSVSNSQGAAPAPLSVEGVTTTDVARATPIADIALDGRPNDLAVLPDADWTLAATDFGLEAVVTEGSSAAFGNVLRRAFAGGLDGVAVAPDGTRAYAVTATTGTLHVIDVDDGGDTSIPSSTFGTGLATLATGATPLGVAVTPDGREAWVPTAEGVVQIWDLDATRPETFFEQIGEVSPVGAGLEPTIAFSRDATRAYLLTDDALEIVETAAPGTPDVVSIPAGPVGVVEAPQGNVVYVSDLDGQISVIPVGASTPSQVIDTSASLRGIAVSPTGGLAYAADRRDEEVTVVDLRESEPTFRTVLADFAVSEDPIDVVVSPDGQRVFTISEGAQTLGLYGIGFGPVIERIFPPFVRPGDLITMGGRSFAVWDTTLVFPSGYSEVDFDGTVVGLNGANPNAVSATTDQLWARVPAAYDGGPIRVVSLQPPITRAVDPQPDLQFSNPAFVNVWTEDQLDRTRFTPIGGPSVPIVDPTQASVNPAPLMHPQGDYLLVDDGTTAYAVDVREDSPTFLQVIDSFPMGAFDPNSRDGNFGATRAFTPDGTKIYTHNRKVLNYYDARIDSPTFGQRLGVVDLSAIDVSDGIFQFDSLRSLAISPDGNTLVVGVSLREGLGVVSLVGQTANEAIAFIPTNSGSASWDIEFHPNGRWFYFVEPQDGGFEVIDLDPFSPNFATSVVGFPGVGGENVQDVAFRKDGRGVWALTRDGGLGGQWNLWLGEFTDSPADVSFSTSQVVEVASPTGRAQLELHPNGRRAAVIIPERRVAYLDLEPSFEAGNPDLFRNNFGITSLGLFSFSGVWAPDGDRFYGVEQTDSVVRSFDYSLGGVAIGTVVLSGDDQVGVAGERLPAPVRVLVVDEGGGGVPEVPVRVLVDGGGTVDGGQTDRYYVSDENGEIAIDWTLGPNPDPDPTTQSNGLRLRLQFGGDGLIGASSVVDPETIPLSLVEILPLTSTPDVSVTSSVQAVFSRAVDRSTVTEASFVVRDVTSGDPVPGFIGFSDGDRRVSLIPSEPLAYATDHQVEVTNAITDLDGQVLTDPDTAAFTTAAAAAPTLVGLTPPAGTVGAQISIAGTGFDPVAANNTIDVNGRVITPTDASINSLQFVVPGGATTGPLTVTVDGQPTASLEFTVLQPTTVPIDEIDDTVDLGQATQSMAVLPDGTRGYAVSTANDQVTPIDLVGLQNGTPIPVGEEPIGAVSDVSGAFVYVANRGSNDVSVIETATDTVVDTVPLDDSPQEIVASPTGDRIYVVTPDAQAVEVIDADVTSAGYNTVVARFETGQSTSGASISPDGGVLYLGTSNGFLTVDLGPTDFGVVARFETGQSTSGASISPDGTLLILLTESDEVLLVDVSGAGFGTVVARFETGQSTSGASISPDGSVLYVITEETDLVLAYAIDVAGSVSVLEGLPVVELNLLRTIDAGDDPRWIAFDPRDPSVAFVGATGDLAINVFGRSVDGDCETFEVVFGASWDGVSLQEVLDAEYGAGVIDAATDYEGYACGDAVVPYWLDDSVDGWVIREIADAAGRNILGWYAEDFTPPVIDGVDDGVIFDGPAGEGGTTFVGLDGPTRFGLYMNPNGTEDAINAPEPELFFTNRAYNDVGPDGSGAVHAPDGGDPQALIYDITSLRGGVPTYVIAWEDIDSGAEITPTYQVGRTDNDFNDLVVEIQASSPVRAVSSSIDLSARDDGIGLAWTVTGAARIDRLVVERRTDDGHFVEVDTVDAPSAHGEWVDTSVLRAGTYAYRVGVELGEYRVESDAVEIAFTPTVRETRLVKAWPNPFNPQTTIEYALSQPGRVQLKIYDLAGRLVRSMDLGHQPVGTGRVQWNGTDDRDRVVSSGTYLVRMVTPSKTDVLRVMLLK